MTDRAPHAPGYLSFGPLTVDLQKVRPCPRCGLDPAVRRWNEPCAACKADPLYQDWRRKRKNATDRSSYRRRKAGEQLTIGRPKRPIGGAYA